tara:strand:- start:256 stop:564 length:309 start_codon:yes stop_codon:yes gene_type:complete
MANKIIKYNLTSTGTTPSYIESGGFHPKVNSNASPQDMDLIGATVDGSSEEGLGVFANEAAIKTYLDSYTGDWTFQDFAVSRDLIAFDQTAAASDLWDLKIS